MSIYESLGETTFTINSPTISGAPPFKYTRSIAYNGSYWLAAGTIIVRTANIKSFVDVIAAESDAYSTEAFYKIFPDPGRSELTKSEIQGYLDKAKEIFIRYKGLNYIPITYSRRTVHCFAKSTNGYTWKYVEECPFIYYRLPASGHTDPGSDNANRVNSIAWNGSMWMAVGRGSARVNDSGLNQIETTIATSTDGDTWTHYSEEPDTSVFYSFLGDVVPLRQVYSVTCDASRWIIGTNIGIWKKDFTGTTWTRMATNIYRMAYHGVATNGSTIVGVGGYDGEAQNFGSGLVYNTNEVAGAIVSSTDNGVTWGIRLNARNGGEYGDRKTFKAVAWNGDKWIAVGTKIRDNNFQNHGIVAVSEDGVDWTYLEEFPVGLSCVSWDGNEWFIGGTDSNVYVSKDGILWRETEGDTDGVLTIATKLTLPILGGDINTVNSILVGVGNPASVVRTYNNVDWISQILTGSSKQFVESTRKNFYGAVWSGSKWVIVGEKDFSGRAIAVSSNGIDWSYPTSTLGVGKQVAYGGGLYVAVGDKLLTSSDAETWVERTTFIKNLHCAAYNGTVWVVGGDGGIQYSTNGTSWTKSVTCPLTTVKGVAWNGYTWVAVGKGYQHVIALSKDGVRWYSANESTVPFSQGNSVAWNRKRWVAVGNGDTAIATSNDGNTWMPFPISALTSGTFIAWTGTKWMAGGYGSYPVITNDELSMTWTEYPISLTQVNAFASKDAMLPITGTDSSTVLANVSAVVADLTEKVNATIAAEEAAEALAQNLIAQAAALAKRNATKTKATEYMTRIGFWNTTADAQFQPFSSTTYVDISQTAPYEYSNANSTVVRLKAVYAAAKVYRDRIFDDTNTQEQLTFELDNLQNSVKICEETIVQFYNAIRLLYKEFAEDVYTFIAVTPDLQTKIEDMGFSTQTETNVLTFFNAKKTAIEAIKDTIVETCDVPVVSVSYSNESTDAPDYATLFKTLFEYDVSTIANSGYGSNGTNSFYYLTILNSLYPRIHARKVQCDAVVTAAYADAIKWSTLLGTTAPTLESIQTDFEPLYQKYFRTVNLLFYPTTTFDTPNKLINLEDTPLRLFKAKADTYKSPIAYGTGLQTLYTRLKETTDTVESTRQAAINYLVNKRKTTLKTKLDDILAVTKTPYLGQLSLDEHLTKVSNIVYARNSSYQSCAKLLKYLKNGAVFSSDVKQKIFDIDLADIEAEEDGCVAPTSGWGASPKSYAIFDLKLDLGVEFTDISSRGSQYLIGQEITVPGTFFKGSSPTNDILIKVLDVSDFDGRVSRVSASGTFPSQSTQYTGLVGSRYTGGARFFVTPGASTYTVSLTGAPTSGFIVGQTIALPGTTFRRQSPANDIVITITGVNPSGSITSFTNSGSSTLPIFDDIQAYINLTCEFTFVRANGFMPPGQDLIVYLKDGGFRYKPNDKILFKGTRLGGLSPRNDITVTVDTVDEKGTILTFSHEGVPPDNQILTTLIPSENRTATFRFSNITGTSSYTCTVKTAGSGYSVGDRLTILGSSFGAKKYTNDMTIRVDSVSATGGILTVTPDANFSFLFEQFLVDGYVFEENAKFNVVANYAPSQTYTVTLNSAGNGYVVGEQIVIPGTLVSGKSPANDITITVSGVSEIGAITTFTSSGTPKTTFSYNTKPAVEDTPYKSGRYGRNGWEKYNATFTKRDNLSVFMALNGVSYSGNGTYVTFRVPGVLLGDPNAIRWKDFLAFIKTETYDTIVEKIEDLEDKVAELTSNSELTNAFADDLVSDDLATIQSKYVEFATAYTQGLLNSVNTLLASAKFRVVKASNAYTVTLVNAGYGYAIDEDLTFTGSSFGGTTPTHNLVITVKTIGESGQILTFVKKSGTGSSGTGTYVVTNNKLADRFTDIANAQTTIESNYSTLYNAPGSISGKTNEEIATIVTNAISAKNTITALQSGAYSTKIKQAVEYLKDYSKAKENVLTYEDDLVRWLKMKENAYLNSPFDDSELSNGIGQPFIMSIPPTNTDYWLERTYTLYTLDNTATASIYECTYDEESEEVRASEPIDITTIQSYSASAEYVVGTYAKLNNKIYQCIKDLTPDFLSSTSQLGVKGIDPTTNSECWRLRRYPFVIDGSEEVEFNETMSELIDPVEYANYRDTSEYILGSIVNSENEAYICKNVVSSGEQILGIPPTNATYWREITYPIVSSLKGIQFEAKPDSFSEVDPSALTNVLTNSFKFADFAKADVSYVDDLGYYRNGTTTFQLDEDLTSRSTKGYSPLFTYVNGTKYHNSLMWEYVQQGLISDLTYSAYSSSTVYKNGQYVYLTASFVKTDGTIASSGIHTFKLISTFPSTASRFTLSIVSPFYSVTTNPPTATKAIGITPTETPWSNLGLATLSDTGIAFYSSTTEYIVNDIVRYTVSGTVYKYKFVGTLPTYDGKSYVYFGKATGNKNHWSIRKYPGVYYNNSIIEASPANIGTLNPANFQAYSSTEDYLPGETVSYNNKVYLCGFAKVDILKGVPVSNTHYWNPVRYKLITYGDRTIESAPGSVPKLNPDDYDSYDSKKLYAIGDVVTVTRGDSNLNLSIPTDVVVERDGDVYILDKGNRLIKKIIPKIDDFLAVDIGTNQYTGPRNGTTITASYSDSLSGIAVDDATESIYFTDGPLIRKISSDGNVTTYSGATAGYQDGTLAQGRFSSTVSGLIFDNSLNCLYVVDSGNNRIRKITSSGTVSTLAGSTAGFANGTGTDAKFNNPTAIDIDSLGNVYVADTNNHCIRKITSDGVVTTLAGYGGLPGYYDATGTSARFNGPRGIAVDTLDYVYVADTINNRIRRINSTTGEVITFAGDGVIGNIDGEPDVARFYSPRGMSMDRTNTLYVADFGNNQIRKVRPDGRVLSAIKRPTEIYECISLVQDVKPIRNIPPSNTEYWQERSYPNVFVDGVEYEANPANTDVFRQLNKYDYHRYDNNWMYKFGDLTSYNGKVYQCINVDPVGTESISISGIPPTNDIYWQSVQNDESLLLTTKDWIDKSTYQAGDVIRNSNKLYRCKVGHVASENDVPSRAVRWVVYPPFVMLVTNWTTNTTYENGSYVIYSGKKYKCVSTHTSSSDELPNRIAKWEEVDQITASNILYWDLNIQYLIGAIVSFNGYFYRCEVEHYSAYIDSPYSNKYYWTQITDLQSIGIPPYYDDNADYSLENIVSLRTETSESERRHFYDFYKINFFKCVRTNPDYPAEFTYDKIAVLDSTDADGNYKYGKIAGTWNKHNLPRYGAGDIDPFKVTGFAGKLRRKVWMDIEMPYNRVAYLDTINILIDKLGINEVMNRTYAFTTSPLKPTDYTTDFNFVKNKLVEVMNDFVDSHTGTGEEKLSIEDVISNAYEAVTEDLKDRKTLPYTITQPPPLSTADHWATVFGLGPEPNSTAGTSVAGISVGDNKKCIDQLMEEINIMKMQYFNNPGTQQMILDDPYSFISPIGLASSPPQKLFADLGVGDLTEMQASVNLQEGIPSVTCNPDGTVTFSETYGIVPLRKYTRAELDYTKERTEVLQNKLELISISCFEAKLKIGFGMALMMQASTTKMGGRFICDSGAFDIPIGEWNTLARYSNYGNDGMMYHFYNLINATMTPPEYTLPYSQASRDLAVLTYESQNDFVKGLSSAAKGLVGLTVSLAAGRVTGVNDIINGIASIHAAVLRSQNKEVDEDTQAVIALTTTRFSQFNQNADSIATLKQQVNYYKNAQKQTPASQSVEEISNALTRVGILLQYIAKYEREIKFELEQKFQYFDPPIETPTETLTLRKVISPKPERPKLKSKLLYGELANLKARLLNEKQMLENALRKAYKKPPLPEFQGAIPIRQEETIRKTISPDPPAVPARYADIIKQTRIRLKAQNTTVIQSRYTIIQEQPQLDLAKSRFATVDSLRNNMNTWLTNPTALQNAPTITFNNVQYSPSTMTRADLENLNSKIINNRKTLETEVNTRTNRITQANADIAEASIKRRAIRVRLVNATNGANRWLAQWKEANTSTITTIQLESAESFDARYKAYKNELDAIEVKKNVLLSEYEQAEFQRKAQIQARLARVGGELNQVNKSLSDIQQKNVQVQIENDRRLKKYADDLLKAEAEEAAADRAVRESRARIEAKKQELVLAEGAKKAEIEAFINNEASRVDTYTIIRNQKQQIVALRYTQYQEVIVDSKIPGSLLKQIIAKPIQVIIETLQTTLALTTGVGDIPYSAEEILSGKYFYDRLPTSAKTRIDAISAQIDEIPNLTAQQLTRLTDQLDSFVRAVNSHRIVVAALATNSAVLSRLGTYAIFYGGTPAIRAGQVAVRIGNAAKRATSNVSKGIRYGYSSLGTTPAKRFLGGLGVAMEIGGAAMTAWEGGAFDESPTLGF